MDEQAQKVLEGILAKEPSELTEHDKGFLRARLSYVGRNSRKRFQAVLDEKPEAPEEKEEVVTPDPTQHPADVVDDGDEE